MATSDEKREDLRFEVFKVKPDGSLQKITDAESYTLAMFVAELAGARAPGEYVLQDRTTGERGVLHFGRVTRG